MYSFGDTGSQFTASLVDRLVVCPSSKSIPAKSTAEVRITGKTISACIAIVRTVLAYSLGIKGST
jgi:hypothetical protein